MCVNKKLLLTIAMSVFIFACGKKAETNVERGNREQILFVANGNEPRELDPQLSTGSPESNISISLFEGLVNLDSKTLSPIPGVALTWDIADNGMMYTFKLRENAKWSNGDKLTAHDFVYSWKRALMPNFGSEWAYMKFDIHNAEEFYKGEITDFSEVGVKALDDYTLQIKLNSSTPYFLQLLSHGSYYPVHQGTIEKFAAIDQPVSNWTRPENFVGNGPFVLSEWKINDVIRVSKNNQYWDASNVALNGIHFFPIEDQQSEVRAFRSGQVHLTSTPTMAIEKIGYYRENDPDVLRIVQAYSSYYYEFNTTKKPFDDPRVRKALAMTIDRESLVANVSKGGQRPSFTLVPPNEEGYVPKPNFAYDIERAKELLAEAGYPNGEGFPFVELLYNTQDDHRKVALAIQQMWKETLNIHVELKNQEWKVYLNTMSNLEHYIARRGWIADYVDPSNFFEVFLSTSGNNNSGWKNAEYDELMQKIKDESNREARFALFDEANSLLAEEMPILPIYYYSDINLVAKNVKGWHNNVMHRHSFNRVSLAPLAE